MVSMMLRFLSTILSNKAMTWDFMFFEHGDQFNTDHSQIFSELF
jgi:hypothetical protein